MRRIPPSQFRTTTLLVAIGVVATAVTFGASPSGTDGLHAARPVGSVSLLRASTPSALRQVMLKVLLVVVVSPAAVAVSV